RFARGIDGVVERGRFALRALRPPSGEVGFVGRIDAERFQETVAETVGDVDLDGVALDTGRVGRLDRAARDQAPCRLDVSDLVGFERVAAVVNLYVAD